MVENPSKLVLVGFDLLRGPGYKIVFQLQRNVKKEVFIIDHVLLMYL